MTNNTLNKEELLFKIDENNYYDITNNNLLRTASFSSEIPAFKNILDTIKLETLRVSICKNLSDLIRKWSETNQTAFKKLLQIKNLYSLNASDRLLEASKVSYQQLESCINLLEATTLASSKMEINLLKEIVIDNKDKFIHDLDTCNEKINKSDTYVKIRNMRTPFEEYENRLCKAQLQYELGEWQKIKRQTDNQIQAFENRISNENREAIARVIDPDFVIPNDVQNNVDGIVWPNIENRIDEPQFQAHIQDILYDENNADINPTGYINLYKIKNFSKHRINELSGITSTITLPLERNPKPDNMRELYNNKQDYLNEIKTFREYLQNICHVNTEDIPQYTSRRSNPKSFEKIHELIENKREEMKAYNYSGDSKLKELNTLTRRVIITPQKAFNDYVMKPLASFGLGYPMRH